MPRAQVVYAFFKSFPQALAVILSIEGLVAYPAANKVQADNIIPLISQEVLKRDGILGADPPALTAPGAQGHVMEELPLRARILVTQR